MIPTYQDRHYGEDDYQQQLRRTSSSSPLQTVKKCISALYTKQQSHALLLLPFLGWLTRRCFMLCLCFLFEFPKKNFKIPPAAHIL